MINTHLRIKELRLAKRLKQSDIAKAAGISNTAFGKIENGITKSISVAIGIDIARSLGVYFNDLFDIDTSNVVSESSNGIASKKAYYNTYPIEAIDMMVSVFGAEVVAKFCLVNAFKYRLRIGLKNDSGSDLAKEQWYLAKFDELCSL